MTMQGWKLVPIELTREMWDAVNKEDNSAYAGGSHHGASFEQLWDAAVDSAPVAPQAESVPVAWRHTMYYERSNRVELSAESSSEAVFGRPDIDYDKSFRVSVEPLFTGSNVAEVSQLTAQLAEMDALLREMVEHDYRFIDAKLVDFVARIEEVLSAAAEPAYHGHMSDCSTNNRGVPELLGPCDCGYEK